MQAHAAEGQQRHRKKPYYLSVELQALASLPSPASHCSRAQHPSQANHSRGWRLAAGCAAGERVPCTRYGAGSSSECHPIHPPEHHRTGPQSQLIPPWGYRGILPARQPSGTTVHILSLNHKITAGPQGLGHPSLASSRAS